MTEAQERYIEGFTLQAQIDNEEGYVFSSGFRSMADRVNDTNSEAKHDSSPCLRHSCVACCVKTEMPLTNTDIERIEKLGFKRANFTVEVAGEIRLRNRKKICFFLENYRCSIYFSRPEGCRIYPLVYDVDIHKFVYDHVCLYSGEFKPMPEDKERLKRLIRRLDREAAERASNLPSLI